MLFFVLFTTLSARLIVATPLPALPAYRPTPLDSNSCSTLFRRAPPKFEIPTTSHFVGSSERKDVLDKMREHYETKATDAQKGARLAIATSRWIKHLPGREHMNFEYHEGDTTDSPTIGRPAEIYRDKPMPKMYFVNVLTEYKEEMRAEGAKRYNSLRQDKADEVKSMKVWGDWDLKGGIREKSKLTFHSTTRPRDDKVIGDPTTIYRPLTLRIPHVGSARDGYAISDSVRTAHTKMVADQQDHLATTSNYGTVYSNWHHSLPDANGRTHKQVVVALEEVSEDEERRKHLGDYAVRMGTSGYEVVGLNTGRLSSQTETAHSGPLRSNDEVVRPSNSQKQQHLNVGSPPTHALSNPGSSHLNSQGSSQFNAGSSSSHPGPSHPELLHPASPQPSLQLCTSGPALHNEFYMLSPEVWRPWDPLSQPSHDTRQSSDLYSDHLWHAQSPHVPSNSQILPHSNSPSSQYRVGSLGPLSHPEPSHPGLLHPVPPQQPLQSGSPPLHNEFYMPSPEVWRPWDPLSQPSHDTWQSSHPDFYNDQLWHAGSPHTPSNSQILSHSDSPLLRPGLSHPELAQSSSAVMLSQQAPQVGPSSNPGGLPHSDQPDAVSSPEIWHLLNPDSVYPYPWNPHQQSP